MAKLSTFQQIRDLKEWRKAAMAATLTERMWPNYVLFCQTTNSGDIELCRKVLDLVWQVVCDPKQRVNFQTQAQKLEEILPEPTLHDTYGVYPAVDFMMALLACCQLLCGEDETAAVVVSKLSQGCVEAFVIASEDLAADSKIDKNHPLMAWEIDIQQQLVGHIQSTSFKRKHIIELRNEIQQEAVSNIGIELQNR